LNLIHSCLKRLVGTSVSVLRTHFVHWTKPPAYSLPLGTLADLARSKAELIAENALLRQQLIILKRQVKRPACTKTDRILLVLLARAVRAWKQALLIVQPETLLTLASRSISHVVEAQVKGPCSRPEAISEDRRFDQGDGRSESSVGCTMTTNGLPKEIKTTSTVQQVVEIYHDVAVLCEGSYESLLAHLGHGFS
jgi:hypothetical protein